METCAIEYLRQNPLKHMDMIVPLKRGTAELIYAANDGVCFRETESGAWMISVSAEELGRELLNSIPNVELVSFHQAHMREGLEAKFSRFTYIENFQAVYFGDKRLPICNDLDIRPPNSEHLGIIVENYDIDIGLDYLRKRLESGALFGGFVGGVLVGFAGIHAEGSIGMLKIFSEHRNKGYGEALTSFVVNHQLNTGIVPFGQAYTTNIASLTLMRKLGFEISSEPVYWIFKE
ncbi:MAG: N-acetyltransferase [Clostridiales bacterium]|jgi:tRNA (guanine37-N1)-methyltransferase|nr:N-acetyltransferase [Clostridiales bacterium]